tara:strand:+ start:350 stop:454 length:105 start_codon:yes stop_codon:yes gene_type:complete
MMEKESMRKRENEGRESRTENEGQGGRLSGRENE